MQTYIEDIARHEGQPSPHGLARQSPIERQDSLPAGARRLRVHPGRHVEGRGGRRDVRHGRTPVPGERDRRRRHRPRRHAGAGRLRAGRDEARGRQRGARLPDHAEGARRRLPHGSAPPLDSVGAPAGRAARAARGHRRGARLLQLARLHPGRYAHLHAVGLRRARRRCFRCSTSRTRRRISRRAASSTTRPTRWRSGGSYCFGPTFRAEKSKTRRHLTEFWMVEPEVAYADLDDVIVLAEGLVAEVVARVLDRRRRELVVLERDTTTLERVQHTVCACHLRRRGLAPEGEGARRSSGVATSAAQTKRRSRRRSMARWR